MCFSSSLLAQLNGSGFYRLRNSVSNEYMRIVHDTISAQKVVGSLSNLQSDAGRTTAMNNVQPFLQTDIKMVNQNTIFTDPGTVIYLEKQSGSSNNYDVLSQGVGLKYISTCVYVGTNAKAWGLKGMPARRRREGAVQGRRSAPAECMPAVWPKRALVATALPALINPRQAQWQVRR